MAIPLLPAGRIRRTSMPIRATMTSGGVWTGALGSTLLATVASSNVFSESSNGWPWPPMRDFGELVSPAVALVCLGLGFVALTLGWWSLRPMSGNEAVNGYLVLALWSLPLLIVPPLLSPDAFLYADLAWIQHQGANPYMVGVGTMGGPYVDQLDAIWIGFGVAYPPLAVRAHYLATAVMGFDPYWGMVGQRLLAMAGVGLIAAFLPSLARSVRGSSRWAVWFGVLNPIIILECVGGAHNDALMVGVVVLGLWLATRTFRFVSASLVVAPMVIGIGMCLKPQAGLAALGAAMLPVAGSVLALPLKQRLALIWWRPVVASLVAIGTFTLVSLATGLAFGWTRWLGVMGRAKSSWSNLLVAVGAEGVVSIALPVVAGLALVWLILLCHHKPIRCIALGSVLVAFMGQILHPWYLVLGIVLLGADRPPARLVAALQLQLDAREGHPDAWQPWGSAAASSSVDRGSDGRGR